MPTLTVYSLPSDGTMSAYPGDHYDIRTTTDFVWVGYNDIFTYVEEFVAYLIFDTSGIPSGSTITSAQVSVYVDDVVTGLLDGPPKIQLLHSPWTPPLDGTDWPDVPPPSGSMFGPTIVIGRPMIGTVVTYEVTNLSIITPAGLTSLRLAHNVPYEERRIRAFARLGSGDNPDTTKRPTLTVTYTPPQPPPENSQAALVIEGQLTAVHGIIPDIYSTVHTVIEGTLSASPQAIADLVLDVAATIEGVIEVVAEWTIPPVEYPVNAVTEGMFEALPESVINPPPDVVYQIAYNNVEGMLEVLGYTIPAPPRRMDLVIEGRLDATGTVGGGGGSVVLQRVHAFVSTAVMRPVVTIQRVFGNPSPANVRFSTQVPSVAILRGVTGRLTFTFTTAATAERHRTVTVRTTAVTTLKLKTTTFRRK